MTEGYDFDDSLADMSLEPEENGGHENGSRGGGGGGRRRGGPRGPGQGNPIQSGDPDKPGSNFFDRIARCCDSPSQTNRRLNRHF